MIRWLTTITLAICLCLPMLANADPLKPSIKQQIDLGKKAADQIRKEEKVLPATDPRVIELRRLGALALAQIPEKESKDKPFEYTFDVIDSKELNAFAMPGGPIFFYTGLLDKMKTEDEVIGILSHEITHVRNQHWASQYADTMKRKLGLMVVLTILNANSDILNATDMLDDIVVGLKYSRKHETEADTFGYDMMTGAGYNPRGMVDVFQILLNAGGSKPPEILSTHPDTAKRIESLKSKIQKDKRKFPAMRSRKSKVAMGSSLDITWVNGWPNLGEASSGSAQTSGPSDPLKKQGGGLSISLPHWPAAQLLPQ
ncbi:MAG: M48 family metallopeptidase [Fimbriimonadaceae bacterium]